MFWRKQREHDLERELRSDLELEAEERQERGLSPEDAQYAATRAFGDTTSADWLRCSEMGQHAADRFDAVRFARKRSCYGGNSVDPVDDNGSGCCISSCVASSASRSTCGLAIRVRTDALC